MFKYAVHKNPGDAQAHFQLGCLLANLGRVDEAIPQWQKAAELSTPSPPAPLPLAGEGRIASIAWRNLGLAAAAKENDLAKAALLEAGRLARTGHISPEGRKRIRYGTRGLSMLPKEVSHD